MSATTRRPIVGVLGGTLLAVLVLASMAAPLLTSHGPLDQDLTAVLRPPGTNHWFGTDELGRDVYTRVLYGGRIALAVTTIAAVIAAALGLLLGLLGALFGGWVDGLVGRLADVQLAIPTIVLALVILSFVGNSLPPLIAVLVCSSWVLTFRVVRGHAQAIMGRPFIEAARLSGARRRDVAIRHLLPGVLPLFIVAFTLNASAILLLESSLGFLGLGVQPPTPDWGSMDASGQARLDNAAWVALFPGAALILAVVGFQLTGDALAERFQTGGQAPRRHRPGRHATETNAAADADKEKTP
ncbi:ABC transporter permease [Nocardia aurantiaca]|uniref:ABC transporter permease subunit n=1 Tax=Nocardia aurantiaca TaxID=2675850 RepID=A0A6I3L061_9NOCA|nr:ABC transporter permease [Nocardia aurantiaca]MTE15672.1 ABC transporter permease subunit [Nocardia aurantiaca]